MIQITEAAAPPGCFGASAYGCVTRISAPCDLEIAYVLTHMGFERLDPFDVAPGALVDGEGRTLTPETLVEASRESPGNGYGEQLSEAMRGDRGALVGDRVTEDEADIFHSAHVELDYAKCKDRDSSFRVREATGSFPRYDNARFGYTLRYPNDWEPQAESANGDGRMFKVPGAPEGAEIGVVGRQLRHIESPPPDYKGPEAFVLNDGSSAQLYVDAMGDSAEFYVTLANKRAEAEYEFFARTSLGFYESSADLLRDVARSLRAPRNSPV